jgi:hypothetical protein
MPSSKGEDRSDPPSNPYRAPDAPMGSRAREARAGRRPGPPKNFAVECSCGRSIPVSAAEAGSIVSCPCGAEVDVPGLGRLRESAGQDRYESGPADAIGRMIRDGELPAGPCVISGKPTGDFIELDLLLPRFYKTDKATDTWAILILGLLPALLLAALRRPKMQEEGATRLRVPIRVATARRNKARSMGQRGLKRLLRKTPIYATLIEENPDLRIIVVDA